MRRFPFVRAAILMTVVAVGAARAQTPLGTEFTYQGVLKNAGAVVSGTVDIRVRLFDAAGGGTQIGGSYTHYAVTVDQGYFTIRPDFGLSMFSSEARWLELSVRIPAGSGSFVTLSPRQPLTAAPVALYSLDSAGGTCLWEESGADICRENGNVGIGQFVPLRTLHVQDDDIAVGDTMLDDDDLIIEDGDAQMGIYSDWRFTWGSGIHLAEVNAGALVDKWSLIRATTQGGGSLHFRYGTDPVAAYNTNVLALTKTGRVGIGIDAPVASLHLANTSSWTNPAIQVERSGIVGNTAMIVAGDGFLMRNYVNSTIAFGFRSASDSHLLDIQANGYIGVGTSSPTAKLHIGGTAGVDGLKFPDGTLQTSASRGIAAASIGVDPPNLVAGGSTTISVTVTGAAIGDLVVANPGADLPNGYTIAFARVSAANTVRIGLVNGAVAAQNPAASNWLFRVIK